MSLTKKQLEIRRTGIGASEIAALIGASKWSTPIAIFESKLGIAPPLDSYAADLGNELEAPIARVWAKREGRFIALVDTLRHPERPFALATPDRAVYTSAAARGDGRTKKTDVRDAEKLLQVKSTNWRQRHLWGEEGTDSIPDEYVAQCHWEGAVAGQQIVDVAVDFDKTALHTYRIVVDQGIFAAMYEVAERFMIDHVARQIPPPPDASERYGEYLTRAFPSETSADLERVIAGEDLTLDESIALFCKLKSAEKRMDALMRLARNRITARIGGATGIIGDFGKITWKKTKDGTKTDWRRVADEALRIAGLVVQTMPEGDHRAELAEDVRKLIEVNTVAKVGHRVLRPAWSPAFKLDAQLIDLRLEALQDRLEGELEDGAENGQGAEQQ